MDFAGLIKVLQAEYEAQATQNYQPAMLAVQEHTLDGGRLEGLSVIGQCPFPGMNDWISASNERVRLRRQDLRREFEHAGNDLEAAGKCLLEQGDLAALAGELRQSQILYRQAKGTHSSVEARATLAGANADLLQRHYSMILNGIGKSLRPAQQGTELGDEATPALLQIVAAAAWNNGNYADAASALLWLQPGQFETAGPWLQAVPGVQAAILTMSAVLGLSRDDLTFFARADPVFAAVAVKFPKAKALVDAFLALDIPEFWKWWLYLSSVISKDAIGSSGIGAATDAVRLNVHYQYFQVYAKTSWDETRQLFAQAEDRAYTLADVADESQLWDLDLSIDDGVLSVSNKTPEWVLEQSLKALAVQFVGKETSQLWHWAWRTKQQAAPPPLFSTASRARGTDTPTESFD